MDRTTNIMDFLAGVPEWDRLELIREIIPLLRLPSSTLMNEIVNQDKEFQDSIYDLDDSEFIRYYLNRHPEIDLPEEIADRREFEWEEA